MGVFGAVDVRSPEAFEAELRWIDAHINGKPTGVDFIVPARFEGKGGIISQATAAQSVPPEYKEFARSILRRYHRHI